PPGGGGLAGARRPAPARPRQGGVPAPPGPLAATASSATPSCFASCRTAGVAWTRPGGAIEPPDAPPAADRAPPGIAAAAASPAETAGIAPPSLFQRVVSASPGSGAVPALRAPACAASPPTPLPTT